MSISVDIFAAFHDRPKVRAFLLQVLYRGLVYHEGVLLFPPGVRVKGKGLDQLPRYIIKSAFCFYVTKLDHPRPDTEMGHMQVPRQLLAYHLELFTSVTITMYLPAKLCNLFSGIRRGHHQAITAAIGLLFNKVDRVLDLFCLIYNGFPRLHLPDIIASHLLQAEEQIMLLVMVALVVDVKRRIVPVDLIRVDNDRVRRNHHGLSEPCLDVPLFSVCVFLLPVLSDGQFIFLEEDNALHVPMLIHRVEFYRESHPFYQLSSNTLLRVVQGFWQIFFPERF